MLVLICKKATASGTPTSSRARTMHTTPTSTDALGAEVSKQLLERIDELNKLHKELQEENQQLKAKLTALESRGPSSRPVRQSDDQTKDTTSRADHQEPFDLDDDPFSGVPEEPNWHDDGGYNGGDDQPGEGEEQPGEGEEQPREGKEQPGEGEE